MRSPAPRCFCGKGARGERRAPRFRSGTTSGKPGGRARPSPPRPALECAARRRRATGRQEGQTASGSERFRARVTPGPQLPACRATSSSPPGRRRATPRGGAGRGEQPPGPAPAVRRVRLTASRRTAACASFRPRRVRTSRRRWPVPARWRRLGVLPVVRAASAQKRRWPGRAGPTLCWQRFEQRL